MTVAFVTPANVREYLGVTGTTGNYSDGAIGSNIIAASEFLERMTGRFFGDRTQTMTFTSQGQVAVTIPGLRTASSVNQQAVALVSNEGYYLIPDTQNSGVFTGIQLRGFGSRSGGPWWLGNPEWFDRNLDHPRYGGGWSYSLPNDLVIAGDWGYTDALLPYAVRHACKVLAGWYTKRPDSVLASVAITPEGNVLNYADMPPEVSEFIDGWKLTGASVVSVG